LKRVKRKKGIKVKKKIQGKEVEGRKEKRNEIKRDITK
jgi:hypothetical protein